MFIHVECLKPDIFFTDRELYIIQDRLNLRCCLYDAFADDYTQSEVDLYIDEIERHLSQIQLVSEDTFSHDAFDVLCECVNGSTYLSRVTEAYLNKGFTKGEYSGIVRVCRSIEKKFKQLGFNVSFPQA